MCTGRSTGGASARSRRSVRNRFADLAAFDGKRCRNSYLRRFPLLFKSRDTSKDVCMYLRRFLHNQHQPHGLSRCASTAPAKVQDTNSDHRARNSRRDSLLHPPLTRDRQKPCSTLTTQEHPIHPVTACTGHDPSAIVERIRLGPSEWSTASPLWGQADSLCIFFS